MRTFKFMRVVGVCLVLLVQGCSLLLDPERHVLDPKDLDEIELTITPSIHPGTDDTLSVSFDRVRGVNYAIKWNCMAGPQCPGPDVDPGESVPSQMTVKTQEWEVAVTPSVQGTTAQTSRKRATIVNTAPTLHSVSLSSYSLAITSSSITAHVGSIAEPDDGDTVHYHYCWYLRNALGDENLGGFPMPEPQHTLELDGRLANDGNQFSPGSEIRVEVRAYNPEDSTLPACDDGVSRVSALATVEPAHKWRRLTMMPENAFGGVYDELNERFLLVLLHQAFPGDFEVAEVPLNSRRVTMLRPVGAASAPPASLPTPLYDAAEQRMLLVGVKDVSGSFDSYTEVDIRQLSLATRGKETWASLHNQAPPLTTPLEITAVYDAETQRIFVWLAGPSVPSDLRSEREPQLWSYSMLSGEWTQHPLLSDQASDLPDAPFYPRMVLDHERRRIVLFVSYVYHDRWLEEAPGIYEIALDAEPGLNVHARRISKVPGVIPPLLVPTTFQPGIGVEATSGVVHEARTDSVLLGTERSDARELYRYDLAARTLTPIDLSLAVGIPVVGATTPEGELVTLSNWIYATQITSFEVSGLLNTVPRLDVIQGQVIAPRILETGLSGLAGVSAFRSATEAESSILVFDAGRALLSRFDLASSEWSFPSVASDSEHGVPDPAVGASAPHTFVTLGDGTGLEAIEFEQPLAWELVPNADESKPYRWQAQELSTTPPLLAPWWMSACDTVVSFDPTDTLYLDGADWVLTGQSPTNEFHSVISGGEKALVVDPLLAHEFDCSSHTWFTKVITSPNGVRPTITALDSLTPYRDGHLLLKGNDVEEPIAVWSLDRDASVKSWRSVDTFGLAPEMLAGSRATFWDADSEQLIVITQRGVWSLHLPSD